MTFQNKIHTIFNIILSIILVIGITHVNNKSIESDEIEILCYDWDVLWIDYEGIARDSLLCKLGKPHRSRYITIGEHLDMGRWFNLQRFKKNLRDTLVFEELYYKDGIYDFYLWLLPNRDSTWRVVDAVKYDPKRVQF